MFGLIGKKLGHSFSKIIHEKLNSNITYSLIETNSLNDFFSSNTIEGINVTIPYKSKVIKYLDSLDSVSQAIGVVNTIVKKNEKLIGYNTDYFGLDYLLSTNNITVENKNIVILGNGSTMRTIEYYCMLNKSSKISILARNPKKNEHPFKYVSQLTDTDIVFNATPVGMFPNNEVKFPFSLSVFTKLEVVIDLVYNPIRTNLLLDAEALNIKAVNGLLMLVAQAVKAASLFYNTEYEESVYMELYYETLMSLQNLVFIGMPMSGKSYITRLISTYYEKELNDLDSMIELTTENSIESIFKLSGEPHFRTLENDLVKKLYKSHNMAVSCGGGIVLNNDNIRMLKQNGIVIFLDVPLNSLTSVRSKKRPLISNSNSVINLYNKRYHLYVSSSDVIVNKTTYSDRENLEKIEVSINEYFNTKWS